MRDGEGRGEGSAAARIEGSNHACVFLRGVISHRRGRTATGNFTWNALVPLADIALRRAEGRTKGEEGGEWVNVRPVGWSVHSKKGDRIVAKFFGRKACSRCILSLSRWSSSASTDDSRRLTGWSASDGGQVEKRVFDRRVFYSRLLAHPNWPLPPFNVVISLLVFRPSRPRARASLISLVSKGIFQ